MEDTNLGLQTAAVVPNNQNETILPDVQAGTQTAVQSVSSSNAASQTVEADNQPQTQHSLNLEKTQETFALIEYSRDSLTKLMKEAGRDFIEDAGGNKFDLEGLFKEVEELDRKFRTALFDVQLDQGQIDSLINQIKAKSNRTEQLLAIAASASAYNSATSQQPQQYPAQGQPQNHFNPSSTPLQTHSYNPAQKNHYFPSSSSSVLVQGKAAYSQKTEADFKEIHDKKIQIFKTETEFKNKMAQLEALFKSRMAMLEQDYQTKLNIDSTVFASNHFMESAIHFERLSSKWLDRVQIAMIWVFVFLFISFISVFLNISFSGLLPIFKEPDIWELNAVRVATFTVLVWVVIFCAANYRRNRRLADMYQQRSSLFNIYPALIKSVSDKSIMDKMMRDMSREVFHLI